MTHKEQFLFDLNGYVVLDGVLTADEVAAAHAAIDRHATWSRTVGPASPYLERPQGDDRQGPVHEEPAGLRRPGASPSGGCSRSLGSSRSSTRSSGRLPARSRPDADPAGPGNRGPLAARRPDVRPLTLPSLRARQGPLRALRGDLPVDRDPAWRRRVRRRAGKPQVELRPPEEMLSMEDDLGSVHQVVAPPARSSSSMKRGSRDVPLAAGRSHPAGDPVQVLARVPRLGPDPGMPDRRPDPQERRPCTNLPSGPAGWPWGALKERMRSSTPTSGPPEVKTRLPGATFLSNTLAFLVCVESGKLEDQTILLCRSIRRFGGAYPRRRQPRIPAAQGGMRAPGRSPRSGSRRSPHRRAAQH